AELRFPWPAMARAEDWLGGLGWDKWDLKRHTHLQAAIAAGMLHAERDLTPEKLAPRLDPARIGEYLTIVEDALVFAHTGKTRAERIREWEEKRAQGEAMAASQTTPTE